MAAIEPNISSDADISVFVCGGCSGAKTLRLGGGGSGFVASAVATIVTGSGGTAGLAPLGLSTVTFDSGGFGLEEFDSGVMR